MKQKNEFNVPPPSEVGTRELRKEIQKMKRDNRFLRMRLATNMARKQVLQDTLRNTAALQTGRSNTSRECCGCNIQNDVWTYGMCPFVWHLPWQTI